MLSQRQMQLVYTCLIFILLGCGSQVKDAPVERMSEQRPSWIKSPAGKCKPGFRCLVVQGEAPDLSDARSSARAKGVSELVSELAVRIRSRLSVNESQQFSNGSMSEDSQVSQTIESRVRGQLVGVRTLSEYWERRFRYSSTGSTLSYQSWLTVGVPISTLDSLRDDAKQRTARFETDAARLAQTLEAYPDKSVLNQADTMVHLQSAQDLVSQQAHLIIDSPTARTRLDQITARLTAGLNAALIEQGREVGGNVKLAVKLTLFGAALPSVAYEISNLSNGKLVSSRGKLSKEGHLHLSLSAVAQLKPITFSVSLLSPSPASIPVSVPALLPTVPMSLVFDLDPAIDTMTLRDTLGQKAIGSHPGAVACTGNETLCFELSVVFHRLNEPVRVARGVYQSRGRLRVHLVSPTHTHLQPVERTLQGSGTSRRQSQRDLLTTLTRELERLVPALMTEL